MSRISSCERFFIGKIGLGFEEMGKEINQHDVECLLGDGIKRDVEFIDIIKKSLSYSYSKDISDFKNGVLEYSPDSIWEESIIKLYKGRDTLLRDVAVEWYSKQNKPGFWEMIKGIFKR